MTSHGSSTATIIRGSLDIALHFSVNTFTLITVITVLDSVFFAANRRTLSVICADRKKKNIRHACFSKPIERSHVCPH